MENKYVFMDVGLIDKGVDINKMLEDVRLELFDWAPKFILSLQNRYPGAQMGSGSLDLEFFAEQEISTGITELSRHLTKVPYLTAKYRGKDWSAWLCYDDGAIEIITPMVEGNPFNYL